MSKSMFAYVGCYTTKDRDGRGKGISVYHVDMESEKWSHVQLMEGYINPSFLALDHKQEFLYAVHGEGTKISAYKIDGQTGKLSFVNEQPTNGKNGVHLAIDPTNRFVAVANYSTGTIAVLPINQDGSLAPLSDLVALQGTVGPNPAEQPFSHPHHIPFYRNGKFIIIPDKGFDKVFIYRLDSEKGKFIENTPLAVQTARGIAPRHVGFHPYKPYAYVLNELASSLTAYLVDENSGNLTMRQTVSAIPTDFEGKNKSAEIVVAPSGKFVYTSNRGHDSIVIFSIDQETGLPVVVGWEPTRGKKPRFITINPTGNILYAANEDSDMIAAFAIDDKTGKLSYMKQVAQTGSPACIVFKSV